MKTKMEYQAPEMELVELSSEDVLIDSVETIPWPGNNGKAARDW